MFRKHIPSINDDIRRTRKAIISIGCSFVQAHGAISQEIYDNYRWAAPKFGEAHIKWDLTETERQQLLTEHPDITYDIHNKELEFQTHEYNNSFVNILSKKYFEGDYAAINLGRSGSGNRASIKELYFYPDILWNEIEEIIVIYCPSGLERVDFITDEYHTPNDHGRWKTMWPSDLPESEGPRHHLWKGYKNHLYSEKFEALEQIAHVQELILWCKYKKAKLIIVPGFSPFYNKQYFTKQINKNIVRDNSGKIISSKFMAYVSEHSIKVANMWPWDNMFQPEGCPTFADLMMKQEFPEDWSEKSFYGFIGTGTPNKWITPCCHPSVKGHDLFAKYLYEELTANPLQYNLSQRIGNL